MAYTTEQGHKHFFYSPMNAGTCIQKRAVYVSLIYNKTGGARYVSAGISARPII